MPTEISESQITIGGKKFAPDHPVRFSFVTIDEAKLPNEPKPGDYKKFSVQCIVSKKSPDVKRIQAAMKAAAKESKDTKGLDFDSLDLILRDGDNPKENKKKQEHLLGHYFFNASSSEQYKPEALGTRKDPATGKLERLPAGAIKSGYYGSVNVKFFGYSQKGNSGIAARLNAVQLMKPGELLGSSFNADAEFEADEGEDFME
jgi:hypothetical protein